MASNDSFWALSLASHNTSISDASSDVHSNGASPLGGDPSLLFLPVMGASDDQFSLVGSNLDERFGPMEGPGAPYGTHLTLHPDPFMVDRPTSPPTDDFDPENPFAISERDDFQLGSFEDIPGDVLIDYSSPFELLDSHDSPSTPPSSASPSSASPTGTYLSLLSTPPTSAPPSPQPQWDSECTGKSEDTSGGEFVIPPEYRRSERIARGASSRQAGARYSPYLSSPVSSSKKPKASSSSGSSRASTSSSPSAHASSSSPGPSSPSNSVRPSARNRNIQVPAEELAAIQAEGTMCTVVGCPKFGQHWQRSQDLQRHLSTHGGSTCKCSSCGKPLSRSDAVKRHWNQYCPENPLRVEPTKKKGRK